MKVFAQADGIECYLAKIDGQPAGGGTLAMRDGVAGLFGASTLPAFRNRGVQAALIAGASEAGRRSRAAISRLAWRNQAAVRNGISSGEDSRCCTRELNSKSRKPDKASALSRWISFLNEIDDVLGGSAGKKDFGDAGLFQGGDVGFRDDAANQHRDIVHAFFAKQIHKLRANACCARRKESTGR